MSIFDGLFGDGYVLLGDSQSAYNQYPGMQNQSMHMEYENMFKQQAYNQQAYNSQKPPADKSSSKFTDSPERIIDGEYVVIEIDGKKLMKDSK